MAGGMLGRFKRVIARALSYMNDTQALSDANVTLSERSLGMQAQWFDLQIDTWRREELLSSRYSDSRSLARFEHRFYSQDGSDGILREIFRRIGEGSRYFVEFGIGNGLENNTALLVAQGWRGLWIEADSAFAGAAAKTFEGPVAAGRLAILQQFVTAENIESLFEDAGVPEDVSLISVDIDGNDYWVWKAIERWRPAVLEIEYNAWFPSDMPWVMRYNATHTWNADTYQGASLHSLCEIAAEKGYTLVACTLAGINAIFVRDDLVDEQFVGPFSATECYQPPRYFLVWERGGQVRAYGPSADD